jgi:hypothetical protein
MANEPSSLAAGFRRCPARFCGVRLAMNSSATLCSLRRRSTAMDAAHSRSATKSGSCRWRLRPSDVSVQRSHAGPGRVVLKKFGPHGAHLPADVFQQQRRGTGQRQSYRDSSRIFSYVWRAIRIRSRRAPAPCFHASGLSQLPWLVIARSLLNCFSRSCSASRRRATSRSI